MDFRIGLVTQRLEVSAGDRAAAEQAKREAQQAVRNTESVLLISEARSLALKGELATASDKICSLDNDRRSAQFHSRDSKRFRSIQRGALLADSQRGSRRRELRGQSSPDTSGRSSKLPNVLALAACRFSGQF